MPNKDNPQDQPTAPIEEKQPEYSHEDIHENPMKEIAENKELPKEGPEPTPEPQPKEEPVEKVEEKEIEPSQLAKEIIQGVAEEMTPKEETVVKDEYQEFFDKIKAEKGREPNWIELSKFLNEQAIATVEKRQEDKAKVAQEEEEKARKSQEELSKRYNAQIDEELEEIYNKGDLTPIKDAKNPSDQGVVERKALFQAMLDVNIQRQKEGKPPILSISRIFYGGYYTKPNVQPAGADAPVSMGSGSPAGESEQEIDYVKDVKRPWSAFRLPNLGKR